MLHSKFYNINIAGSSEEIVFKKYLIKFSFLGPIIAPPQRGSISFVQIRVSSSQAPSMPSLVMNINCCLYT